MAGAGQLEDSYSTLWRLRAARPLVGRGVIEELHDRLDAIRAHALEGCPGGIPHAPEPLARTGPVDGERPLQVRDVRLGQAGQKRSSCRACPSDRRAAAL